MRAISLLLGVRHRRPRGSRRRTSRRRRSRPPTPQRRHDARAARAARRDDSRDLRHRRQRLRPEQSRRGQGALSLGEPRARAARATASSRTSCCSRRATRSSRGCSTSRRARCARAASSPRRPSSPAAYDAATNSVDVNVHVRDSWSLALDLKLNRTGGQTEWGIGLSDNNLFGTGKTLEVALRERDRSRPGDCSATPTATCSAAACSLRALFANASDGHRRELAVERPFFSLDTRWSLGGSIHDEQRVDTMYDLGEEIDEFGHDIDAVDAARRLVARRSSSGTRSAGCSASRPRSTRFARRPTSRSRCCCRRTASSSIRGSAGSWIEDDYREMTELNDMGRTEDISLGLNVFASVGFAKRALRLGPRRDAAVASTAEKGWEPGGPGRLLLLETGASTRREDVGYRNSAGLRSPAHYYRRNLEKHLFSVELERARDRRPRSREPGAARRRQRPARLPDPLPSRREPHGR